MSDNLPVELTSFIGREDELATIRALLLTAEVRLLTLTGPGGTGKTRLAVEAARRLTADFPDGICFANLGSVTAPDLLPAALAASLGLPVSSDPIARMHAYLADRRMLLLFDNFEHLAPAAPLITELLRAAPQIKVLVTSRMLLHVSGEHRYPVAPLRLPCDTGEPPAELARYESVQLFAERAAALQPDFVLDETNLPVVAEICCRLDGLPLAIELAAARVPHLSPAAMLDRLEPRLPLLTGGAVDRPRRHRTLRHAIDWSYKLLDEDEQRLFRSLSVFRGGWTLAAAEAVSAALRPAAEQPPADMLQALLALVDKSLIHAVSTGANGEVRFEMLETVREYAHERLVQAGEAAALRQAHAAHYLSLTEAVSEQNGENADLAQEQDNMAAAREWLAAREAPSAPPRAADYPVPGSPEMISGREMEVLALVARGMTNREVARQLAISPLTVNAHLRSVYAKLGVKTRTAAARFAVEHEWV